MKKVLQVFHQSFIFISVLFFTYCLSLGVFQSVPLHIGELLLNFISICIGVLTAKWCTSGK